MPSGIYKRKAIIKKGDKFNKLIAIEFSCKKGISQYWLFKCDCGNEKIIRAHNVKNGMTKSCGCLRRGIIKYLKHGMCGTRTYNSWAGMKGRCLNKNHSDYKNYGGRGITVCKEWMKFGNFYKDMGIRPIGKTLDRIKNNGNYCKENCRWATYEEQNNNSRHNIC